MVRTYSTMTLEPGTAAPAFTLPDAHGKTHSLKDFKGPLVVAFLCNHCPFVKHLRDPYGSLAKEYQARGVSFVAINPNDFAAYPDDAPAKMIEEAKAGGYTFPYLVDATQAVAKSYRAACTPDFFVFDKSHKLAYRGQIDASRPGNNIPVTGSDLRVVLDALVAGKPAPGEQKPSMGCNIKWKPGQEPDYFKP